MTYSDRLVEAKSLFLDLRQQGYEFREALYKASQSKEVTASDLSKYIRSTGKKTFIPKSVLLFQEDYDLINQIENEKLNSDSEEPSLLYYI